MQDTGGKIVVGATLNVDETISAGNFESCLTLVHNAEATRLGMWGPGLPYAGHRLCANWAQGLDALGLRNGTIQLSEWALAEPLQWLWAESTSNEQVTNLVGRVEGKLHCCDRYRPCLPGAVRARLAARSGRWGKRLPWCIQQLRGSHNREFLHGPGRAYCVSRVLKAACMGNVRDVGRHSPRKRSDRSDVEQQ